MSIELLYTGPIRQLAREGRVPANLLQPTARATVVGNRLIRTAAAVQKPLGLRPIAAARAAAGAVGSYADIG